MENKYPKGGTEREKRRGMTIAVNTTQVTANTSEVTDEFYEMD